MWRRNLRHFIGALHKPERTDGTLFNFFFYIGGGGLRELILKVYFIEFSSLWKTCGTRHPMGHEEEMGTNNFCLVELDPLLRIV